MKDYCLPLLIRKLRHRMAQLPGQFITQCRPVRAVLVCTSLLRIIQTGGPRPAHRSVLIAGAVGGTDCQIALQTPPQPEIAHALSKGNEDVVHNIFGGAAVIQEGSSHLEQIISILLVYPTQGIAVATVKFAYEQLVFQHQCVARQNT